MRKPFYFLISIFIINLVGMYYQFYFTVWWFDMLLHFLGGFFMAMFMAKYLADVRSPSKLRNYLIIIGVVSFIGVMWEFTEYLASQILIEPIYNNFGLRAYFIGDLDDTMNDLLMDILGALSFSIFWLKTKTKSGLN